MAKLAKAAKKKDGKVIEEEKLQSINTPNKAQSNVHPSDVVVSRQKTELNLEQENKIPAGVI